MTSQVSPGATSEDTSAAANGGSIAPAKDGAHHDMCNGAVCDKLRDICFFYGPVWNDKGKSVVGGVMTLLMPILVAMWVYSLVDSIANAPIQVNFKGVSHVGDIAGGLKGNFKCTSLAGCIIVPNPCNITAHSDATTLLCGGGKIIMSPNENKLVQVPFTALQNGHWLDLTLSRLKVGLISATLPAKIGELSGIGSSGKIDVAVPIAAGNGASSVKLLVTEKTLLSKSKTMDFAPDDNECPTTHKQILPDIAGSMTALTDKLYPWNTANTALPYRDYAIKPLGSMAESYGVAVCSSAFYLQTVEKQPKLSWSVIMGLIGGAFTLFTKLIGLFVKICCQLGAILGLAGHGVGDVDADIDF